MALALLRACRFRSLQPLRSEVRDGQHLMIAHTNRQTRSFLVPALILPPAPQRHVSFYWSSRQEWGVETARQYARYG